MAENCDFENNFFLLKATKEKKEKVLKKMEPILIYSKGK